MEKVIVADDEQRMRKLLADFLKREGYAVYEASNGKEALEIFFSEKDISLLIVDVMMPECDGWSVCREVKRAGNTPLIMLTARGEESDEIFGFELGADEYVKKPFSPRVLMARVNAIMRRNIKNERIEYKNIKIDEVAHEVALNGNKMDMSPKEYELLVYLLKNQGITLSRDTILNKVWGYGYAGDERTVDTHIKKIREKLGNDAEIVKTVRGYGYKVEKNEISKNEINSRNIVYYNIFCFNGNGIK